MVYSCLSHWPSWSEWTILTAGCEIQSRHPSWDSLFFFGLTWTISCSVGAANVGRVCCSSSLPLRPMIYPHHDSKTVLSSSDYQIRRPSCGFSQPTNYLVNMGVEHDTVQGFMELGSQRGAGRLILPTSSGTISNVPNWMLVETHTSKKPFGWGGMEGGEGNKTNDEKIKQNFLSWNITQILKSQASFFPLSYALWTK